MNHKRILIVDDDPDLQSLLRKRLEHHGFQCSSAFTVESALEKLHAEKPHLVILDLGFKEVNGTAFLHIVHREWQAKQGGEIPPIIVLSGYNEQGVVDYVLDQGAVGFLAKPVDPEVLLSTVNDFIAAA